MRSLSLISLILTLYSTAILAVPNPDQLKKDLGLENVIIFSHVVAKDTPKGKGAERLKQLIEERKKELSGFLRGVQVYPDSVLFDDTKVMQALADNKVQLAAPSISKLLTLNPKLKIFDLPFLFKDVNEALTFYNSARDKLFFPEKIGDNTVWYLDEGKKYPVLGLWHGGMKQITSNKEIIVFSDKPLEGSKFRIQSSQVIESTFKALGASIEREDNFAKVRKMLGTKKINGQENTWSNIWTEKFYKYQQFFLESNHGYLGYLLITNQRFFGEHLRDASGATRLGIFNEVTGEVNQEAIQSSENAKREITQYLEKLKIEPLEGQQREKWCKQIYESQYSEWKQLVNSEVGKEIVQMAIQNKTGCPHDILRSIVNNPS